MWPDVQHGRFMAALYYRLNSMVIDVADLVGPTRRQ
jgi:DNA-binding NtrC family response regulator